MDRNQLRLNLLKITLTVLVGTTWAFSSFLFASRPEDSEETALSSLVRLPASLPSQLPSFKPSPKVNAPVEMDIFKLGCFKSSDEQERETSAHFVRITGKQCGRKGSLAQVTIKNETNGYQANIFTTGDRSYTTDFIPLQTGRNDLIIHFEGSSDDQSVQFIRD